MARFFDRDAAVGRARRSMKVAHDNFIASLRWTLQSASEELALAKAAAPEVIWSGLSLVT